MIIGYTVVKELRWIEHESVDDDFIDCDIIATYSDIDTAKAEAIRLNNTAVITPNRTMYESYCICIEDNERADDYIEAEDLGLVKENLRRKV